MVLICGHARCETALSLIHAEVVTSRAMASLRELLDLFRANMEKGAVAVFLKGQDVEVELTEAAISSSYVCSVTPSLLVPAGSVVAIRRR